MKTYSSKSAARKGAKRQNLDLETLEFKSNEEGRWYWEELEQETFTLKGEKETFTVCPHCDINLDNGYQDFEGMLDSHNNQSDIEPISHEFMCLGCGEEFGEPRKVPQKGTGIKIEKDRPEQNGIVRPSIGGVCRAVWDACDSFHTQTGRSPLPKEIKSLAAEEGWNVNNALIEMYQWRKFNGITGRVKA